MKDNGFDFLYNKPVELEPEEKETSLGLFDIIKDISNKTNDVLNYFERTGNFPEKEYNAFLINKAFSFHNDSILAANEMNRRHQMPPNAQYLFLRSILQKRNRFSKWPKVETDDFIIELSKYYKWTIAETRKNLKYIPQKIINELQEKFLSANKHEPQKLTKRKK